MKTKHITLTLVALLLLASCEKEYTCSCREVDASTGQVTKYRSPQKEIRQLFRGEYLVSWAGDIGVWHGNKMRPEMSFD